MFVGEGPEIYDDIPNDLTVDFRCTEMRFINFNNVVVWMKR